MGKTGGAGRGGRGPGAAGPIITGNVVRSIGGDGLENSPLLEGVPEDVRGDIRSIEVYDDLRYQGREINGWYDPSVEMGVIHIDANRADAFTVRHEVGHMAYWNLPAETRNSFTSYWMGDIQDLNSRLGVRNTFDATPARVRREFFSTYATSDHLEGFADAFAMMTTPGPQRATSRQRVQNTAYEMHDFMVEEVGL